MDNDRIKNVPLVSREDNKHNLEFDGVTTEGDRILLESQNKRNERSINRETRMLEEKKKNWELVKVACSSLLMSSSLALGIFSAQIKPSSVDYYFGQGARDVSITQSDPNDYRTKTYHVSTLDSQGNDVTYNVPFDTLEEKVPRVTEHSDMINLGTSDNMAMVQVSRRENYPITKGLTIFGSIFSFFGGVGTFVTSKKNIDEINDSIDKLNNERHR